MGLGLGVSEGVTAGEALGNGVTVAVGAGVVSSGLTVAVGRGPAGMLGLGIAFKVSSLGDSAGANVPIARIRAIAAALFEIRITTVS